jgi:hypothetical protein
MALPDYTVNVYNKSTGKKSGNIGGAWIQEDGRINIQLNPGAALIGDMPNQMITLFPYEAKAAPAPAPRAPVTKVPARRTEPAFDDMDDDIPF